MTAIHETKLHGTESFHYALYGGRLPEWLPGFPMHWHDEMEIIHITKGSMIVGIQNEEILIHEGDTVLIQPQRIHSIKQNGDQKAHYFNILFRLGLLAGEDDICLSRYLAPIQTGECTIPRYLRGDDTLNITISPYLRQLRDIAYNHLEEQELMIKSLLLAVLHFIHASAQPENPKEQYTRNLSERLKKALDHIHHHYNEEITVETAASLCNFSASHFSRMFRQLTGVSFNQYLISYRLETAEKMLKQGQSGISEVAFACGFNNLSYFSRSFKLKYGVSPHQFKKNLSQSG